jgi:hypothetical protein
MIENIPHFCASKITISSAIIAGTWRTRGQREAPLNVEKLVAQFNVLRGVVDQKRAVWTKEGKTNRHKITKKRK